MSLPEVLLWRELRRWPDVRFRRQQPAGPYSLDFYCAPLKLAIEIDGISHDMGDRPERDAVRDEWLAAQHVLVLRITAREVLSNLDGVIRLIAATINDRS
ncbi:endonuclease domain-containing protein [Sphingomonas gilva]